MLGRPMLRGQLAVSFKEGNISPKLKNFFTKIILPKTNRAEHLKMDGFKIKFLFGKAYFQGLCQFQRG